MPGITYLFANNAQTSLAAGITSTATSLTVVTGTGAKFPNPGVNQAFMLVLIDNATKLVSEIMVCTARSGDTMTVIRGQEGTFAVPWLAGDLVFNLVTAGSAGQIAQVAGAQSAGSILSGSSPYSFTPVVQGDVYLDGGTITALTISRGGTQYNLDVGTKAVHLSANDTMTVTFSAAPAYMSFLPSAAPSHITYPSVPTGVTATVISSSQIDLSWNASTTGTFPLSGYNTYKNGVFEAATTGTTYSVTGLSASTTYSFAVSAYDTDNNNSAQSSPVSATTSAGTTGFLPAGHFINAKQPMILVYPRPDTETGTFARHRWAYYDGVNPVEFSIPIGVSFGAYPYVFTLTSGPSGMAIGSAYNDANYGVLTWTPTGIVTNAAVAITVTDQQNNTINVTFTISTSSSTSQFIFVDAVNGLDTNAGTFAAPLQTLAAAYGSTFATVVNPGAICYLRAGTYTPPIYADQDINTGWPMMEFSTAAKPAAMIGLPGDTLPVIDMTSCGWGANINVDDLFFKDLNPNGYLTTQTNYRLMWYVGAGSQRLTADNVGWTNSGYGASADNNATGWFIDINNVNQAANIFLNGCYETNRQSGQPGNNYAGCSVYNAINMLVHGCYTIQDGLLCDGAWYLKSDSTNGCIRGCTVNVGATGGYTHAFDFGQAPDSQMNNNESCYNRAIGNGGIFLPFNGGFTFGPMWGYRNSCSGTPGMGSNDPTSGGPYVYDSNAIQTSTTPMPPTGSSIQSDGLNLVETSGLLDSNGNLTIAYASYVGTVGAQIG